MKFLIRDDDTCAFTSPDELIKCYGHIWDEIPVNLSVTPFRVPGQDKTLLPRYKGSVRIMPLEENHDLVRFLQKMIKEEKIHIALHGFHHTKSNNQPEYIGGHDLERKTREGKEYLENLLHCIIETFVPPNNGIAREGMMALLKNKLNLIGVPSLIRRKYRPIELGNIAQFIFVKSYQLIQKSQYPHVLEVNGHKEAPYCSVTPAQRMDLIENYFELCRQYNGVFIFATHYHAFEKRLQSGEYIKDVLDDMIARAKNFGDVQFCTYNKLWNEQ